MTTDGTAPGFFAGVVDEVRIWNTARTLAQIQAAKDTEITTAQPDLLGVWNLNDGQRQQPHRQLRPQPDGHRCRLTHVGRRLPDRR